MTRHPLFARPFTVAMRHFALLGTLVAGIAAAPAYALDWPWQGGGEANGAQSLRPVVSIVTGRESEPARSVPGVVAARYEVDLGFQTLGRLVERPVETGDVVLLGQRLASLNPEDLQGNVDAATAAVNAAEVQLRTARAATERTRELARRNVASVAVLEQAETALAAAEAAHEQASSELIRARDARSFATLTAPFAGVISDVYQEAGAIVSPGAPVVKISADSELEAVIDLPEQASSAARIGDSYTVWVEGMEEQLFAATIRVIEPVADPVTRTRRIRLTLGTPQILRIGPAQDLRIGALIRARPADAPESSLTIPAEALVIRDGVPHVWVVARANGKGSVSLRAIITADPAPDDTAADTGQATGLGPALDAGTGALGGPVTVLSGLETGEEIVTRGTNSLVEGQSVGRSVTP